MRRTVLGFGLLIGLLVLGFVTSYRMEARHAPIAACLDAAAVDAGREDWEGSGLYLREAKSRWERGWTMDAALADHAPMEQIDSLFARLEVFCREKETAEFSAGCKELSRLVKAMTDAQKLSWWNLF